MPLSFLKKLADRLLSKPPPADKAASGKKEARGQQGRGTGGRQDRTANADKQSKGWAARSQRTGDRPHQRPSRDDTARPPRAQGDANRGPRRPRNDQQRPAVQQADATQETNQLRPPARQGDRPSTAPHGGRSIARPETSRHSSRGGRGGRSASDAGMNTASHAHRPGGAIASEVMEKRRVEHEAWTVEQYQVPEAEGKKRFHDFDLPTEILHAVADKNFQYCTPIQQMSLEHALAGKNVAGRAQTGTGKTAAFLVAILTRYLRSPEARQQQGGIPRALVIAPTRELVIQICKDADALGKYCGLRSLAVYGGMDYERQKKEVRDAPVDLLVATPGRLLDFVRSRVVDLSKVDTLVIDEADRMLDMGFIPDVRSIMNRLPPKEKRCTMLYSATLTEDVMRLASQWMEAPVRVEVESDHVPAAAIKQVVYVVTSREKFTVLFNHIQQYPDSRILVFCNRKTTTEDVAHSLMRRGITCETLSGDVNQNRRLVVLEEFREGKIRIVIATDVAGRGLHVDNIGFVINFDFPYAPEDYVHRIGRTGRAGQSGVAISFADEDESFTIPDIEKYIGEELKCTVLKSDDPLLTALPEPQRRGGGGSHQSRGSNAPRSAPAAPAPVTAAVPTPAATVPAASEPAPSPLPAPTAAPQHEEAKKAVTERRPSAAHSARPAPERSAPARARHSDHQQGGERRHTAPRHHEERPSRPSNVHQLPPLGGRQPRFSEEWVPGGSDNK